jgi:hypothetical protein
MTNIMDDYEKDLEILMLVRRLRNRPEIYIHE